MTLDNQRLLMYSVYGLGLVLWYVVWNMLGSLVEMTLLLTNTAQPEIPLFGSLGNLSALLALGITVAAAEYTRRHPVANKFGIEVISELRKVTWPTWKDVKGTTVVVIAVSLVVAVILFSFDKIYDFALSLIYKSV